jgi:hypothetical protein
MARLRYSYLGLAAIAGGIGLTAIEVVGAVGYLMSQDQPSYLVAGGAAVTVVAAMLVPLASVASFSLSRLFFVYRCASARDRLPICLAEPAG